MVQGYSLCGMVWCGIWHQELIYFSFKKGARSVSLDCLQSPKVPLTAKVLASCDVYLL